MKRLEHGEVAIVSFSENSLLEMIKETVFENCCEIANVENDITDMVTSIFFSKDKDGKLRAVCFFADDTQGDVLNDDIKNIADRLIQLDLCNTTQPRYYKLYQLEDLIK